MGRALRSNLASSQLRALCRISAESLTLTASVEVWPTVFKALWVLATGQGWHDFRNP